MRKHMSLKHWALSKKSTILLDYVPQAAKVSKTLQIEKLDVIVISSLDEATLHSIDDALTPAANWVLALQDMEKILEETISVKITVDDIQVNFEIPFVSALKANVSSRFGSQDVVSVFSSKQNVFILALHVYIIKCLKIK